MPDFVILNEVKDLARSSRVHAVPTDTSGSRTGALITDQRSGAGADETSQVECAFRFSSHRSSPGGICRETRGGPREILHFVQDDEVAIECSSARVHHPHLALLMKG